MTAGQVLDDNTESLEEAYYYLLVRQSFLMLTFWWTGYKHVAYLIRTSKICLVHGGVQQKHRAPFSLFIMKNMLADREQRAGSRAGCGRRCRRKWCFRLSPCESTLTPDGSSESRVSLTTTEIYLEAPCFSQGAHTHTHTLSQSNRLEISLWPCLSSRLSFVAALNDKAKEETPTWEPSCASVWVSKGSLNEMRGTWFPFTSLYLRRLASDCVNAWGSDSTFSGVKLF